MEIIYKKTSELIPYENNPRINDHAVKAVANSIKEFGFKNPIVIDKNNVIAAGHTRVKASEQLGIEEVPCIMADDLTDEQIKAFRLADNKTAELADWDFELLNKELAELSETDFDFDMTDFGFDFDDLLSFKDIEFEKSDDEDIDTDVEIYPKDEIVDDAFNYYREQGFPFPDLTEFQMKQQINKLASLDAESLH